MKTIKFKKIILFVAVIIILTVSLGVFYYSKTNNNPDDDYGPKPESNSVKSYYTNEFYYSCSKEISGRWVKGSIGPLRGNKWEFRPNSQENAEKFCRINSVIEYHAVLAILNRPEIADMIEKYDTTEAWVKVVNSKLIKNPAYLARILPEYKNINIHCIVVVHTPEVDKFFIENGDIENDYIEVASEKFLASLNKAGDQDVNKFWLSLR